MAYGYKLMNFCEVDKYAVKSYCAIHNESEKKNLGDITKVNENEIGPFNVIVGGSPCQDFSVAGKTKGSTWHCKKCGYEYNPLTVHFSEREHCPKCGHNDIDKSRSSLLIEWLRVIRANKPDWGIYENVKNIVGKQFKDTTFKLFENELKEYGYNTYWKVLNAKNYGIPQSRERVYLILIKKELDNGNFKFPESFDNGKRFEDVLNRYVDEKYYISSDKTETLLKQLKDKQVSNTVRAGGRCSTERHQWDLVAVKENEVCQVGNYRESTGSFTNPQTGRVYKKEGISPTLNTMQGGDRQPKVIIDNIYDPTGIATAVLDVGHIGQDGVRKYNDYTPTLNARDYKDPKLILNDINFRIRKLTPLECYRLMGFTDTDFENVKKAGISDTQIYKQAGNSIVTDVLFYIYAELYKAMPYLFENVKLSSYFSGIGAFEKALDRFYRYLYTGKIENVYTDMERRNIETLRDVKKEIEVKATLTPDRLHKRQNGRRFKEDGEECFTLTAQDRHGVLITEVKSKC